MPGGFVSDVPYVLPVINTIMTNAGDPTGALTPTAINVLCIDTTNHNLYIASTAAAAGWKLFTRAA
jgi:hypothetical protein